MHRIVGLLDDGNNPRDAATTSLLPPADASAPVLPRCGAKLAALFEKDRKLWRDIIERAKSAGEIRAEVDTEETVAMFREVFYGLSFEQAFLSGLDTG